jgi:predicted NAD/FAD-dependent oxidoreductase
MNKLQILDNEHHIVVQVTSDWPNKDQDLAEHIANKERYITIPMPQMIRLLQIAIKRTSTVEEHTKQLKAKVIENVSKANNIGHMRTILQDTIEDINFEIQCDAILTAYNSIVHDV